MPTIQALKKKLRGIRSTQKIAQAMKTASTVKFSKLNSIYDEYSKYSEEYRSLYLDYSAEYNSHFAAKNTDAPVCLIVITANKGMCGNFNSQMLKFVDELLNNSKEQYLLVACGKKAENHFEQREIKVEEAFTFSDIPKYEEAYELFSYITSALKSGKISAAKIAYPEYSNMMSQTPTLCDLFAANDDKKTTKEKIAPLYFPDKDAVISGTADKLMAAFIFAKILETALGAQAATLLTMRSAYDTASEYSVKLESEINRKRQSQVTADVIETSTEYSQENE